MFEDVLDIVYEIKVFVDNRCVRKHYCVRSKLEEVKETCNNYLKAYNKQYSENIVSICAYDNNKNTTVYSINSTDDL